VAKVLNIDAISGPNRILTLGGKEYPVDDLTVDNFIKTTNEAEKLKDEKNQAVQVGATVDMIMRSVPNVPREVLLAISIEKLMTIVRFIQGSMDEEIATAVAEGEEKKL